MDYEIRASVAKLINTLDDLAKKLVILVEKKIDDGQNR